MAPETINRLRESFAEYPEVLQGTPASDSDIAAAQQRLGCRFHPDYIEFLKLFGCGIVGPDRVYGIGPVPHAMGPDESLVHETEHFRAQHWPGIEGWYIISDDGRGNPIGLCPDGKVRLSDRDVGDIPIIADDFEAFLLKRLK